MRTALVLGTVLLAMGCSQSAPEREAKGSTDSLIVGGNTASVTAFEGMIQTENDDQGAWCGATLIAADWAVTAAHCVFDEMEMSGFQRAVLGRQNTSDSGGETIKVAQVIRHESYDADTHQNDIALLHLSGKSKHKPVRLVTQKEWPSLASAGTQVTVVGWGATKEGGAMSNSFRQVTVPIVNSSTCNKQYEGIITDSQVCAGSSQGGKDSCQGDSGGPLFEKLDGVNVQVGVVSFGNGCAEAKFAGVYTSIASFRDWIETNTKGAVPAEPPKVEPKPAPDSANDDGSEENTGATSDEAPSTHKPRPTKDSDDSADSDDERSSDDEEDDTPTTSSKKRTSRSPSAAGAQAGGCEIGRGRGAIGTSGRALLVLAAFMGLLLRRQYKKKKDAEIMSALGDGPDHTEAEADTSDASVAIATPAKLKLKKLRLGKGGIVKHRGRRPN